MKISSCLTKALILVYVCFSVPVLIHSQDMELQLKKDTLVLYTSDEIMDVIKDEALESRAKELSLYLMKRGREKGDSVLVSWGYYGRYIKEKDNKIKVKYADSIIHVTKNVKSSTYPSFGYLLKAISHYLDQDFNASLKTYMKVNEMSKLPNTANPSFARMSAGGIANIKTLAQQYQEAIQIYSDINKELATRENYKIEHREEYISNIHNLSEIYLLSKNIDSSISFSERGLKESIALKDSLLHWELTSLNGMGQYFKKKYNESILKLKQGVKYADTINNPERLYYIGKSFDKINEIDSALYYYKLSASKGVEPNLYFEEEKNLHYLLYQMSKERGNQEEQLSHLNRFLYVDSVFSVKRSGLSSFVDLSYDVPYMKEEKKKLLDASANSVLWFRLMLGAISVSLLLLLTLWTRNRIGNRKMQELMIKLKADEVKEIFKDERSSEIDKKVPDDIYQKIVLNLDKFEKEKGFLDPNLTMPVLAKIVDTNTTYLSNFLMQNFGGYKKRIKTLRIEHAVRDLHNDKENMKYTISALGEKYGFLTAQAFTNTFKEIAGVKPSTFIKTLKEERNNSSFINDNIKNKYES